MRDEAANRKPDAAKQARELYEVQARNLARLNAAGARIGFGTDAGISVGWVAHTELADMVAAGMTPAQVIVAATRTSAEILRLDQLGTIARRQERRLHRARCKSARRHHQHAEDLPGLSEGAGSRPRGAEKGWTGQ